MAPECRAQTEVRPQKQSRLFAEEIESYTAHDGRDPGFWRNMREASPETNR